MRIFRTRILEIKIILFVASFIFSLSRFFNNILLSVQRAITNRFTAVDEIIRRYQKKFNDLMTAFEGRAVLETEIAVGRVEDTINLMDITVTRVLGITSDAGGSIYSSQFSN
jgi:hypothetical protein